MQNKEERKKTAKKWAQSKQGKIFKIKASTKYFKTKKGKAAKKKADKKWYLKNKISVIIHSIKYQQTSRGKIVKKKYARSEKGKASKAKVQARRKRNMGWILMFENPFADSVPVEYHHITNAYVVAIPKDLHKLYGGKYHREKMMEIVKQVYLRD